jgi:HlyD family secretion protein
MLPTVVDDLQAFGTVAGTPRDLVHGPSRVGGTIITAFLAVFMLWSIFAPLSSGAVAPGTIAPDGSVRTVQHLEGGIVERIFVREGDEVEAGEPLLALKQVQSAADVEALLDRWRARLAEAARLDAELQGAATIEFPEELQHDPAAQSVMAAETQILGAREAMITAKRHMLEQRIDQLREQIIGFEAQVASASEQLDLYAEELTDKSALYEQGLAPKFDMLGLERAAAEVRGFHGEYLASISRAQQQIAEAEYELHAIEAERTESVSLRAGELRGELAELEQELAARRDVLDRTTVTAPVNGIVSNLRLKTEGGVLGPGEAILDLVPTEEKLVIDVQIAPVDIDIVKVGMPSLVHLTALPSRTTPRVTGPVTSVSADSLVDNNTRRPYFLARVEVDGSELARLGNADLMVGMPTEVIVVAEERTMIEYLLQPFADAFRRAAHEY